jgi:nucleoside-diphosphate-sugar epimerase
MTKTVLVTGAGGFIGFNVVKEYLSSGWFVYALVHKYIPEELKTFDNVKIIQGDVTDENFINSLDLDVDVVAHVAGLASDIGNYETFRKINYEPIKYLSKIPKNKIVYVSSSDVYGIKDFNNATEDTPFCEYPKNPYPHYKIESEIWLQKNCSIVISYIGLADINGMYL